MTLVCLYEILGCMRYQLHNKCASQYGSKCTVMTCCLLGFNKAFHCTASCVKRSEHHIQQFLHRNASILRTGHNWKLLNHHQHVFVSSPNLQLLTYYCKTSDSEFRQIEGDTLFEQSKIEGKDIVKGENGDAATENSFTSNHGDGGNVHQAYDAEWEEELREIKEMLRCQDENLLELVNLYPRLKDIELVKQVKGNAKVLLDRGFRKDWIVSRLLSSQGLFLQISPSELSAFFQELERQGKKVEKYGLKTYRGWYADLRRHISIRLKGQTDEGNLKYLAKLLNVKYEVILRLNGARTLDVIDNKINACLLKEKVDYLLSEGILPEEIGYNMDLLLMHMKFLGTHISEMKATVGEVSIPTLKSFYLKAEGLRNLPPHSKIYPILGCSHNDFSGLQKKFLNHMNQTNAVNVALYLLDKGIDRHEIIRNPYLLGYNMDKVRDCFKQRIKSYDASTPERQRKLLNLVVYHLEYGECAE